MRTRNDPAFRGGLGASGYRVDCNIAGAAGRADDAQTDAQRSQIDRRHGHCRASHAQARKNEGRHLQSDPVDDVADHHHGGQRTGPYEQQRDPELAVVHPGLFLHARNRRPPRPPECPEHGERDESVGGEPGPGEVVPHIV